MSTNKPALTRIESLESQVLNLESQVQRLMMVMSQGFGQLENRVGHLDEVLTATVLVTGRDQVTQKVKELRKERREAEIVKEKETIAKAVELGIISKVDQIAEESLIIGKELTEDGEGGNPFVQVLYSTLLPDYQTKLLLKCVGEKVETPAKGSFEVIEIYQPAPGIDLAETSLEDEIAKKQAEKPAEASATETTEAKSE